MVTEEFPIFPRFSPTTFYRDVSSELLHVVIRWLDFTIKALTRSATCRRNTSQTKYFSSFAHPPCRGAARQVFFYVKKYYTMYTPTLAPIQPIICLNCPLGRQAYLGVVHCERRTSTGLHSRQVVGDVKLKPIRSPRRTIILAESSHAQRRSMSEDERQVLLQARSNMALGLDCTSSVCCPQASRQKRRGETARATVTF